ncbi:MAG: hypothetical protein LLG45_02515 [Actinomycetia bacterium]|nr:hypothetical protein [Actinomycetes bacterium]
MKRRCLVSTVVAVCLLALAMTLAGCGSSEVKWYVTDGLEVVEGEVQFRLSEVAEAEFGVSSKELTQLALTFDPSFFSEAVSGERVVLETAVGVDSFTSYLYANGYTEVAKSLVAFEIRGTAPSLEGE